MPEQARKLSEIMKEMAETLLRNPGGVSTSEAAHVSVEEQNRQYAPLLKSVRGDGDRTFQLGASF